VSLRARLVLVLVFLAALAVVAVDFATYAELSSFLAARTRSELLAARRPVLVALAAERSGRVPVLRAQGTVVGNRPPPSPFLPDGTVGELVRPDGKVVASVSFGFSTLAQGVVSVPPSVLAPAAKGLTLVPRPIHVAHVGAFQVLAGPEVLRRGRVVLRKPAKVGPSTPLLVVAIPLSSFEGTVHRLVLVEIAVSAIVLALLVALAWWAVRVGLRPLAAMERTAEAIAEGDLSRRVEVTDRRSEVGRLGLALNAMLSQIERAFAARAASEERLRQFLADASHELRTPLTSIRGYAELFRRGAADHPEDLEKAMRRIEQEAARMGILVDDLLLLARLDEGRPLERRPVDLGRLAEDAVDDARVTDPGRSIEASIEPGVVVLGDSHRLRQVFANLLANALQHTPPGTPLHVSVRRQGSAAVLEVADEGPGIDEEVAPFVFERFWRRDSSRTRASGGAGLGLSVVAAIAAAHGGSASVRSEPGRGACFSVELPVLEGTEGGQSVAGVDQDPARLRS